MRNRHLFVRPCRKPIPRYFAPVQLREIYCPIEQMQTIKTR